MWNERCIYPMRDTFANDVAAGYAIWVAAVVYVGKEK